MLNVNGATKQQNRVRRDDRSISKKNFVGFNLIKEKSEWNSKPNEKIEWILRKKIKRTSGTNSG